MSVKGSLQRLWHRVRYRSPNVIEANGEPEGWDSEEEITFMQRVQNFLHKDKSGLIEHPNRNRNIAIAAAVIIAAIVLAVVLFNPFSGPAIFGALGLGAVATAIIASGTGALAPSAVLAAEVTAAAVGSAAVIVGAHHAMDVEIEMNERKEQDPKETRRQMTTDIFGEPDPTVSPIGIKSLNAGSAIGTDL